MSEHVLKIAGIEKSFAVSRGEIQVLKGIDLEISMGEFLSIVGVSGVGKSTLLYILSGLDRPTSGDVFFDGRNILLYSPARLAGLRNKCFGFVFQSCCLLPELSALENTMLPGLMAGRDHSDVSKKAKYLLERVGLASRMGHIATQLSGGEEQRVAIARALVNDPKVVFCDEPTGNLDEKTSETIFDLLRELNEVTQTTLVVVTHDESLSSRAGRIVRMIDGRIF